MEKQVYDGSWRGSTNKPTLQAALLEAASSPQGQRREKSLNKTALLHFPNTWLETLPLIAGGTGSTQEPAAEQGGLQSSNSPPQRSSRTPSKNADFETQPNHCMGEQEGGGLRSRGALR